MVRRFTDLAWVCEFDPKQIKWSTDFPSFHQDDNSKRAADYSIHRTASTVKQIDPKYTGPFVSSLLHSNTHASSL
jgi:hypothetical protein